jgi:hypothetical protein
MIVLGASRGSKLGIGLEFVDLFNAVLNEERFRNVLQLQLSFAAVELCEHGLEDGVFFRIGAGWLGRGLRGRGQADGQEPRCGK